MQVLNSQGTPVWRSGKQSGIDCPNFIGCLSFVGLKSYRIQNPIVVADSSFTSYVTSPIISRSQLNDPWRIVLKSSDGVADIPFDVGDINFDGKVDVSRGTRDAFRVYFDRANYLNDNAANFTVTGSGTSGEAFTGTTGDFNADGKIDLAVRFKPDAAHDARVGVFYSVVDKVAAGMASMAFDAADLILVGERTKDGFGQLMTSPNLDLNNDGIDDLVIGASRSDSEPKDGAGRIYTIYGRPQANPLPTVAKELSTDSVPGSGDFLAETGLGVYAFSNNGMPYETSGAQNELWFHFNTLGDGLENDGLRVLPANYAASATPKLQTAFDLNAIPKLRVDLVNASGQTLRQGAGAMSLRDRSGRVLCSRVYVGR